MQYQEVFIQFWEQVKESVSEGTFAKLTMAKTIGKPDLKNIFLRPIYSEGDFKVLLKLRYRPKETQDIENELSLEEAFDVLKPYLKTSFFSVILFTTLKDVTLKINRKGVGSIVEKGPSFKEIREAQRDEVL